ncbi:(d)CMP kinase [Erysipelothrix sp. HDW6C]|uniref:(d)CMP kinase n=1 Tax=Erysipelothrix sp. HDW6C TaxID=2714930 RepID=UPI00140C33C2|nr:(d)CMP kinase [Erysipelothrix sp. HDW6C]QIK70147.1 (d)CMP kinase [Erysipelothrix sp. HDW6C]
MINIAIDGPSASGKSTIAKQLAKKLGYIHIDTGAMYRAVALECLNRNVDLDNETACYDVARVSDISLKTDGSIFVNGDDVSRLIRTDAVSQGASKVSKFKSVRELLVDKQRKIAAKKGFVLDGRDITSVVLPDAEVKIYQTADVAVRAKRRFDELSAAGFDVNYDSLFDELVERDERDMNRSESPLVKVADALEINTTHLSVDEVVNLVMGYIESRGLND